MIEKKQAIEFVVNKILENVFYDTIYSKKTYKTFDYNNEIKINIRPLQRNDNYQILEVQLNGLCISAIFEDNNYWDFILTLWKLVENIGIEYVNELEDSGIYKELKSKQDLEDLRKE